MTFPHRPVAALLGLLVLGAIPAAGLRVCRGAEPEAEAVARVATVAMHSEMGDYEANLARVEHWLRKAHAAAATFVVLPELCITGALCKSPMTKEEARAISQKAMQSALPRLESLCKELNMTLVVGVMEPGQGKFRNSAWVVGPKGHFTTYHKLWLPNETEETWFEAGTVLPVIESQGWKFSVGICADIDYPEYFQAAAERGAELMLCPIGGSGADDLVDHQTGDQTRQAEYHRNLHMKFLPDRAAVSRTYVFYANQAGRSGNCWFPGLALALDPRGRLVGEHRPTEGMIVTEISKRVLAESRSQAAAKSSPPKNSAGQPVAVVAIGFAE